MFPGQKYGIVGQELHVEMMDLFSIDYFLPPLIILAEREVFLSS